MEPILENNLSSFSPSNMKLRGRFTFSRNCLPQNSNLMSSNFKFSKFRLRFDFVIQSFFTVRTPKKLLELVRANTSRKQKHWMIGSPLFFHILDREICSKNKCIKYSRKFTFNNSCCPIAYPIFLWETFPNIFIRYNHFFLSQFMFKTHNNHSSLIINNLHSYFHIHIHRFMHIICYLTKPNYSLHVQFLNYATIF